MPGRLIGVGVGPGAADLLTLRAVDTIRAARIIAYLAPNEGESTARAVAADFITAGTEELPIRIVMRPGPEPEDVYDRAAEVIASRLTRGDDVAFLCEGDALFYGSFLYLLERLDGRFSIEIVPGVSSLAACAAAARHPLARRDEALAITPATLSDAALAALIADRPAAILKVGRHLPRLRALLDRLGRTDAATLVVQASRPDETVTPLARHDGTPVPYFSMLLLSAPTNRAALSS